MVIFFQEEWQFSRFFKVLFRNPGLFQAWNKFYEIPGFSRFSRNSGSPGRLSGRWSQCLSSEKEKSNINNMIFPLQERV